MLRGLVRGGKYDRTAAGELIADLIILPVERWHTSSLLPRIWELRFALRKIAAAQAWPIIDRYNALNAILPASSHDPTG